MEEEEEREDAAVGRQQQMPRSESINAARAGDGVREGSVDVDRSIEREGGARGGGERASCG
jgi:hypothetical protein